MDRPTKYISDYVREKGINLTKLSKKTGIPYFSIYDSLLNKKRDRDLRVGEYLEICTFLGVDPMDFADQPNEMRDKTLDYTERR
ncbi:hypothetical protein [Eubacterium maltosivorans]|uniref:hypothetical protein n=1 Tax=Eubacterium maltosivorans TaxID=2041044 RepID=UPI00189F3C57|nr:hypothetical protein [Eubacterium maltosivorans]